MKADLSHLSDHAVRHRPGEDGGLWMIPLHGIRFQVIASWGMGWDHVSVTLPNRSPTWEEMDRIKRMFFEPHEVAVQLHVAESEHLSIHPFCIHIWRPQNQTIPTPPAFMV